MKGRADPSHTRIAFKGPIPIGSAEGYMQEKGVLLWGGEAEAEALSLGDMQLDIRVNLASLQAQGEPIVTSVTFSPQRLLYMQPRQRPRERQFKFKIGFASSVTQQNEMNIVKHDRRNRNKVFKGRVLTSMTNNDRHGLHNSKQATLWLYSVD